MCGRKRWTGHKGRDADGKRMGTEIEAEMSRGIIMERMKVCGLKN